MKQISYNNKPCLYLIPTPIGNIDDITNRSLYLLNEVDLLLVEDTRTTGNLLKQYGITKKMLSCHEFNEDKIKEKILSLLESGNTLGLVTDQGSPIISDPGFIVSKYIIEKGYNVVALPGATAFTPAIMASGLDANHFLYYGFLNSKKSAQKKELESLKNFPYTMIFYEAPHRINDTLKNMLEIFGNRQISISREISKIHEEIIRTSLEESFKELTTIKGEFVIVVSGNKEQISYDSINVLDHVKLYLDDGLSEMDAIKKVAKERNVAKSIIYKEYIDNKNLR